MCKAVVEPRNLQSWRVGCCIELFVRRGLGAHAGVAMTGVAFGRGC